MPTVPTTAGDVDTGSLGVVLMHEHVFIRNESLHSGWPDFGGWDTETEVAAARDRLTRLRQAGVDTILDMTVPGLGRDPVLAARAAAGTGLKLMFATGYYTYDKLPLPFQLRGPGKVLDGDDRVLESLFERDLTTGIGDTGFRAAVLKLVTDEPGMTEDVERLANAVANVHVRTGAPICTHAHAPTRRGLEQQRALAARGVDLGAVMIGHSNESTDLGYLEQIIDNGSYLGWDRCGLPFTIPLDTQIDTLATLCERGLAGRIMLAHDKSSFIDWFTNAEIDPFAPGWQYTYIHSSVLPALRERGVSQDQIDQMLVRNPAEFLAGVAAAPPASTAARTEEVGRADHGIA
ncbi:MAG TPA: phosphotriesterase-related protein [Streptosporangiaceae bacterium]|nr:phosphotriesterase-related protein [Streptosporangiaceae bacterium]